MPTSHELEPGQVWWALLDPTVDREQGGRRPMVIVSTVHHLELVDSLAVVVPVTTSDRGWPNHVRIAVGEMSFAMTEQPRVINRGRLKKLAGIIPEAELEEIRWWLNNFLVDGT